jgi:hypothetical protein
MTQSATLQMTLVDYNSLLDARKKAEQELAEVRAELVAAKLVDPTNRVTEVTAFARDCLTIARFAVANLPPEMIRGWPHETLTKICETIHVLPDHSINDRDMALDLLNFARDCKDHELRRRGEPKPTKLTAEDVEEYRKRLEADPTARALMERLQAGHG